MTAHALTAGTCGVLCAVLLMAPSSSRGPAATADAVAEGAVRDAQRLDADDLWLVPAGAAKPSALARAIDRLTAGDAEGALPEFVKAAEDSALSGYARLYQGRAELALDRAEAAMRSARAVIDDAPGGALGEGALWLLADAAESSMRWSDAGQAARQLIDAGTADMARAYLRLATAAEERTDRQTAREAYAKIHYEFPLSDVAAEAQAGLTRLGWSVPQAELTREMGRAQTLFDARRFTEARKAFAAVRGRTAGDERSLVDLRLAQCDVRLGRHTQARDTLRLLLDRTWARRAEVEFAYLSALKGLKRDAEYLARVGAFVKANAANPLAEQALDDLGTYYILKDEDAKAAKVFAELYDRNPLGSYADRAAWKAGWWAYRERDYSTAVRLFESAAAGLTRADNRPGWLYWAARAHEQRGEAEAALAGYRQTIAAYGNSYYGREAERRIAELTAAGRARAVRATATRPAPLTLVPGTPPANTRIIQRLLSAGLYDDAILEIRRVQRQQATSPMLDATLAYALNRKGQLRPAINAMRRAYPQFLAEGGEALPEPILKVIFPIEHWDLLRKYASTHDLDPYLLAAQVAQESTFQADVRSAANAYGLMQILPSTGRRFARQMGISGFSTASLTNPEINVRIGTRYLADLIDMLGGVAPALAAYNAGEHRVVRWQAERPGLSRDEFVDDIPFPETQFYVKRILGTAEDYRRLYSEGPRQVAHVR